ncbi:MAG: pseG [Ferruginibacter sp.]|uniref:hypothetical protein n=1 Tax=Ferruginibacter sp. TaxID=1940288 RepID=UPI00265B2779|nr:hypothetical protein [Ferruginibacter sp.]MDB5275548.1 pseG [Ferruginibacter sp.]
MAKQKLLLRADGNNLIGFGHVYRLLALADLLTKNYYLVFALYRSSDFIEVEIRKYCDEVLILPGKLPFKTADEITASDEIDFDLNDLLSGNEIVVLDGYYFGTRYQQAIKRKGCKLVCIDDQAVNFFYADAVINHAPGIDENIYKTAPYTKLFTGLDYAILRQPFFMPFPQTCKITSDVFISLGGSDYFQITINLVRFLKHIDQFRTLHIMCSSSFPEEMMRELLLISEQSDHIKLYQNLTATEIVVLMDRCTYAFVSASTVLLEAYARGLTCFTGFYVNNQLFIYNGFLNENRAAGLGNLKELKAGIIQQALSKIGLTQTSKKVMLSKRNLQHIFQQFNMGSN